MHRAITLTLALAAFSPAAAQSVQLNVVQESLELRPSDILSAEAVNEDGRWAVQLRLAPDAAAKFGVITERNIRKVMQIVIEDRIISAPIILNAIKQGTVLVHGDMTEATARELAAKIKR